MDNKNALLYLARHFYSYLILHFGLSLNLWPKIYQTLARCASGFHILSPSLTPKAA